MGKFWSILPARLVLLFHARGTRLKSLGFFLVAFLAAHAGHDGDLQSRLYFTPQYIRGNRPVYHTVLLHGFHWLFPRNASFPWTCKHSRNLRL